jgi:hypothetical protein
MQLSLEKKLRKLIFFSDLVFLFSVFKILEIFIRKSVGIFAPDFFQIGESNNQQ